MHITGSPVAFKGSTEVDFMDSDKGSTEVDFMDSDESGAYTCSNMLVFPRGAFATLSEKKYQLFKISRNLFLIHSLIP